MNTDPKLAKLYDQMQLITTRPSWSWRRVRAIWQLNRDQLDKLSLGAQSEMRPRTRPTDRERSAV